MRFQVPSSVEFVFGVRDSRAHLVSWSFGCGSYELSFSGAGWKFKALLRPLRA